MYGKEEGRSLRSLSFSSWTSQRSLGHLSEKAHLVATRVSVERLTVREVRSIDVEIDHVQTNLCLLLTPQDLQVTHEGANILTELLYIACRWLLFCHDDALDLSLCTDTCLSFFSFLQQLDFIFTQTLDDNFSGMIEIFYAPVQITQEVSNHQE